MATGSLGDILGQGQALAALRASMASGRVHHAWIFHGPAGVGKFTTAVAFAGALLDPTTAPGLTGEIAPDPDSETQRLVRAGMHPDLHVVTKELALHHEDREVRTRKLITIPKKVVEKWLLEPAALSAFQASLDWYEIDIAGAIDQLGTQRIVHECYAGVTFLCEQIVRDPVTNTISTIYNNYLNVDESRVTGVDFGASRVIVDVRLRRRLLAWSPRAVAALVEDMGLTREAVGKMVGRSRVAISNLLRILDLQDEILATTAASLVVAGILALIGKNALQRVKGKPEKTIEQAQETVDTLKGAAQSPYRAEIPEPVPPTRDGATAPLR